MLGIVRRTGNPTLARTCARGTTVFSIIGGEVFITWDFIFGTPKKRNAGENANPVKIASKKVRFDAIFSCMDSIRNYSTRARRLLVWLSSATISLLGLNRLFSSDKIEEDRNHGDTK